MIKLCHLTGINCHCTSPIKTLHAEDGGPALSEGFQHVIQVTSDSDASAVLRAWQDFTPGTCKASDVLLQLHPRLEASIFVIRADGKFSCTRLV